MNKKKILLHTFVLFFTLVLVACTYSFDYSYDIQVSTMPAVTKTKLAEVPEINNNGVDTPLGQFPMQTTPSDFVRFDQVKEDIKEFPPTSFPINNCGGAAEVTQEVEYSYTHEVVDETGAKLGVDIPVVEWLGVVAEIEKRYAITDKETTSYSTTLTVPAGQNIRYTVIRKQTWESGIVVKNTNGIETRAAYSVLKNESIEVANSEILGCP